MKSLRLLSVLTLTALLVCSCNGKKQNIVDLPRAVTPQSILDAVNTVLAEDEADPGVNFESIMILKHGKVIYEGWYGEAAPEIPHVMHSVSKTFTCAAIGMLVEQGKLSLSDKVIDYFPDDLPEEVSDNLKAMTIYHLLTMTCGHQYELNRNRVDNWAKGFLAHPVPHEPGTWFCYNSLASYMLSAIGQKVCGEKILDFLTPRLFEPLHIDIPVWEESAQGINAGGWGLYLKTEDMAKFGQLLLQKGKWNGQQLISEEWIDEATSYQVPSVPAGMRPDMAAQRGLTPENSPYMKGYGFQVWLCPDGAYRAAGTDGQYIIVYPDADAVIATTATSRDMLKEQELIYNILFPALKNIK